MWQVSKKGDDDFAVRFVSSFLDRMRAEEVRLRHDGERSLVQLVQKVKAFRRPRQTMLEGTARAEHEQAGAVERAHRTLQSNVRALKLDLKARTGVNVIPGHPLFPWMCRHAAWSIAASSREAREARRPTRLATAPRASRRSSLLPRS